MDDWAPPASVKELPVCDAPFEALFEEGRSALPLALVPAEAPLPAPTVVQLLARPMPREARAPPSNFKILTPVPAPACGSERPSSAAGTEPLSSKGAPSKAAKAPTRSGAAEEVPDRRSSQEAQEEPTETLVPDITRWIIEPMCEQRLFVHFASEEVGVYETTLHFEMVGAEEERPEIPCERLEF
ncbi:unnamed protein product [Prorocentrum cordatum]|uniref:Uncharacterized protein n=1 Tax=Prorocentrum cordatum TaxID=2364126 RepID=A0ABN9T3N0_9DINO|nr:unnamed protein product [Polarella glacialis]